MSTKTQTVRIPGQKPHTIIVQDGDAPIQKPTIAGVHQIDSSVRDVMTVEGQRAEREAALAPRSHAPSHINKDIPADPAADVMVGNLTLRPNPIFGTAEAAFVKGGAQAFQVLDADGDPMSTSEGLAALYLALREAEALPSIAAEVVSKGKRK